ncbi:MAG TPA: metalloregulator ArsR/SmtB family transcription factor [Gaiellaceae bacterium]|nr:metalloregulator ArsR/SmtB family transcription factor [Gaiellaceae bacterium]
MNALEALADPTRRRIVELLAEEERSAGEIASHFPTSRPGVSRHLRVLRDAGLVHVREQGQRRLYSLEPEPLAELQAWLENRLDALDTEIRRRRRNR